jgi:hypothetical protein
MRRVAAERDGQVDPDHRAVLADVPLHQGVIRDLPAHEPVELVEFRCQVLGVRDVAEGSCEQLLAGEADDVAILLVDAEEAASDIFVGDADGRILERAA